MAKNRRFEFLVVATQHAHRHHHENRAKDRFDSLRYSNQPALVFLKERARTISHREQWQAGPAPEPNHEHKALQGRLRLGGQTDGRAQRWSRARTPDSAE